MTPTIEEIKVRADCPTCRGQGEVGASPSGNMNDPNTTYYTCPTCFGTETVEAVAVVRNLIGGVPMVYTLTVHTGHIIRSVAITQTGDPDDEPWFDSEWADHAYETLPEAIEAALVGHGSPFHPDNALKGEPYVSDR